MLIKTSSDEVKKFFSIGLNLKSDPFSSFRFSPLEFLLKPILIFFHLGSIFSRSPKKEKPSLALGGEADGQPR